MTTDLYNRYKTLMNRYKKKNRLININFLGDFISIFKHKNSIFYLQNSNTLYVIYGRFNEYIYSLY